MPKNFTNADLHGWYGYHRSGTLLTANGALQTLASVGFIYFDGGRQGAPGGAGVFQSAEITTKLDTQPGTGNMGKTNGVNPPVDPAVDIDPPTINGFYQVKFDGTFKMWCTDPALGCDGTVAGWGVLVGNDEYYAMSLQPGRAVTLTGKKMQR